MNRTSTLSAHITSLTGRCSRRSLAALNRPGVRFRLRFNNAQKLRLGLFNEKKEEELVTLESIDDIFNYADRLKSTVFSYGADSAKE